MLRFLMVTVTTLIFCVAASGAENRLDDVVEKAKKRKDALKEKMKDKMSAQKEKAFRETLVRNEKEGKRYYLAISNSIPESERREYARQVGEDHQDVIMVMNGFIGGATYIRPTIKMVNEMMIVDRKCDWENQQCERWPVTVDINPVIFNKCEIKKVPALVMIDVKGKKCSKVVGLASIKKMKSEMR